MGSVQPVRVLALAVLPLLIRVVALAVFPTPPPTDPFYPESICAPKSSCAGPSEWNLLTRAPNASDIHRAGRPAELAAARPAHRAGRSVANRR